MRIGILLTLLSLFHGETTQDRTPPRVGFTSLASEAGIDFKHTNGRLGQFYYPELMGGGVCVLDYNGDGYMDLYLVNGTALEGDPPMPAPTNHLFKNNGNGTFSDVTDESGTGDSTFGQGCCAADHDGDADVDLYVTNFGANVFYRNNGDGTFTDIAPLNGTADQEWGQGCAFADFDHDTDLDLYVENYLRWSVEKHKWCGPIDWRDYCDPKVFDGAPDRLYRQNEDGSFKDITEEAGISKPFGRGMGLVCGDLDNDDDIDIYVTNDEMQNYLYKNDGKGFFEEVSLYAGVGFDSEGRAEASMGADLGDIDRDGFLDITTPCLTNESFPLYRNNRDGTFTDTSFLSGVGLATLAYTGFSPSFLDADNDGDLDLFISNGKVNAGLPPEYLGRGAAFQLRSQHRGSPIEKHDWSKMTFLDRYAQPDLLLENDGRGHFRDVSRTAGPYFGTEKVGRGTAVVDYDNDGDLDIVVLNLGDELVLLRNDLQNSNHWITFSLRGRGKNTSAVGARVRIRSAGVVQIAEVRSGGGYLSQSDVRVHFGLGSSEKIDSVEIKWPSGKVTVLKDLDVDRFLEIKE